MRAVVAVVAGALTIAVVAGCDRSKSSSPSPSGSTQTLAATIDTAADAGFVSAASELGSVVVDAGGARSLSATLPSPKETISIHAGTFASGSTPGDEGREPGIEPLLVDVKLGAFSIDAMPYPNDPNVAPTMVTSPAEAAKLCAESGARLCTELEWERACKGPNGTDTFATGIAWDPSCDRSPSRCASGFGVRAMGFLHEWTDSRFGDVGQSGPVVRGGSMQNPTTRRCASRLRSTAKEMRSLTQNGMAFRCCHGDRNDVAVPPIEPRQPFKRMNHIDASSLEKIFAQVPELARISESIRIFSDGDIKTILSRSGASTEGITFVTVPLLWSPEPGVEVLVATGRSKKTGFIAAVWALPNDKYRFASSFLLLNDAAPIALAYEPSHRKELRWTTCWGCAGEQGMVSLRSDDGRIVIVQ